MEPAKSPLELAALATVAVPGLQVTELREPQYDDEYSSVTGVVDSEGRGWTVVASKESATADDVGLLSRVVSYLRRRQVEGDIPFEVPQLHGAASTSPTTFAFVYSATGGRALVEDQLQSDGLLAASLGRALAMLHNLDPDPVGDLGVRLVSVDETRQTLRRTLANVGREVPAGLRKRWNIAFDEDILWSFDPAPIHGDLGLKSILSEEGAVISVTGFRYLRIDDPALDLAWILPLADESFVARLLQAYSGVRSVPDLHLLTRAQLYSELALLQWLQYGQESSDQEIITEAAQMLASLDADLGGALLVPSSKPVAEIRFTADDEPLYRLQRHNFSPTEAAEPDESSSWDLDEPDEQVDPADLDELPTEAMFESAPPAEADSEAPDDRFFSADPPLIEEPDPSSVDTQLFRTGDGSSEI